MATVVRNEAAERVLESGDALYEVVNGERVELAVGAYEIDIAAELLGYLRPFARTRKLGRAVAEMLFLLAAVGTKRRPDVAFVSYARWPRERRIPPGDTWDVVPDLAVEVVSPSNTVEEILAKIREYFQAGVRRVWVICPTEGQVYVYQSPTQNHILTLRDQLDGEDILPEFRLAVAALLGEEAE